MTRTKDWYYRLKKHLEDISCAQFLDGTNRNLKNVILACEQSYLSFIRIDGRMN